MQCNSCGHSSRMGRFSLPQLLSVRSSGVRVEIDRFQTSGAVLQRPSPFSSPGRHQSGGFRPIAVPSSPSDNHSSTGIRGSTPSEVSVAIEPAATFSLARGSQSVAG